MAMLTMELNGQAYNKSAHRRALLRHLDGRTEGAVEKKRQNISAILGENRYFWIPGYKPQANAQSLLREEVTRWLDVHPEFQESVAAAANTKAVAPAVPEFGKFEVDAPEKEVGDKNSVAESSAVYGRPQMTAFRRDYAAIEARNSSLGLAGEELAVAYERHRLLRAGLEKLADEVEHVSKTQGDGVGFDILSFEADGRERFIEVKTTAFGKETPFFASAGEVKFSNRNSERFHLYRLFEFRKNPRCFVMKGAITEQCKMEAVSYRCSF